MTLRRLPPLKSRLWDPAKAEWFQGLGWLWQPLAFGDVRILLVSAAGHCSVLTHTLRTTKMVVPRWLEEHVAALYSDSALVVDLDAGGAKIRRICIHDAMVLHGKPLGNLSFPDRLERFMGRLRVESIGLKRARTYNTVPTFGPDVRQLWGRSSIVRGWHEDASLILKL